MDVEFSLSLSELAGTGAQDTSESYISSSGRGELDMSGGVHVAGRKEGKLISPLAAN